MLISLDYYLFRKKIASFLKHLKGHTILIELLSSPCFPKSYSAISTMSTALDLEINNKSWESIHFLKTPHFTHYFKAASFLLAKYLLTSIEGMRQEYLKIVTVNLIEIEDIQTIIFFSVYFWRYLHAKCEIHIWLIIASLLQIERLEQFKKAFSCQFSIETKLSLACKYE